MLTKQIPVSSQPFMQPTSSSNYTVLYEHQYPALLTPTQLSLEVLLRYEHWSVFLFFYKPVSGTNHHMVRPHHGR